MSIKFAEDIGAPLAVVAVDLASESMAPQYNEALAYAAALGGGAAAYMNKGGDFAKNIMIAAIPWAAKKAYVRVRAMMGGTATARVAHYGMNRMGSRVGAKPQFAENVVY